MRLLLFAGLAFAQTSDPISDRLRYEIAAAQRDYLIARQQLENAQKKMADKTAEADKICSAQKKVFKAETFTCEAISVER